MPAVSAFANDSLVCAGDAQSVTPRVVGVVKNVCGGDTPCCRGEGFCEESVKGLNLLAKLGIRPDTEGEASGRELV